MKANFLIKAIVAIAAVWAVFATVSHFAGGKKATAARFIALYNASSLTDGTSPGAAQRGEDIEQLAIVFNSMDFKDRERLRQAGGDREFFDGLSTAEQELWIELTIEKSFRKFMQALDAMTPDQRQDFIDRAIAEWEKASSSGELDRLREYDPTIVEKIVEGGMTAYYQDANSETKLSLAPLMEITNETVQGIRGTPFDRPMQ